MNQDRIMENWTQEEQFVTEYIAGDGMGWNPHGSDGHYIIGRINGKIPSIYSDTDYGYNNLAQKDLREKSGINNVYIECNYSGWFVSLHKNQMLNIEKVINTLLNMGISIWLQNIYHTIYNPGQKFIETEMENYALDAFFKEWEKAKQFKWIKNQSGNLSDNALKFVSTYSEYYRCQWLNDWNWHTNRGKNLAKELIRVNGYSTSNISSYLESSYLEFPKFKENLANVPDSPHKQFLIKFLKYFTENNYLHDNNNEPSIHNTTITNNNNSSDEMDTLDDDDTECLICLDRKSNTIVLPCMHVAVCQECSDGLENTNDANTCVKCRNPITSVINNIVV